MFKGIALYKKGEYKVAIDFIQSMLTNQRFDVATTAEMNFLMGLAGKKFGDIAIVRQGFSMAMISSLKDAAEIELRALRDTKATEEDSEEDIIKE